MDIGIADYTPADLDLAAELGATWVRVVADLTDRVPDQSAAIRAASERGMRVVADMRTAPDMLCDDEDAVEGYARRIRAWLLMHPQVRDVEIWGGADSFFGSKLRGHEPILEYPPVLQQVHMELHMHCPEVRVWTGGHGIGCNVAFLSEALVKQCPRSFDVCNWHPLVSCGNHYTQVRKNFTDMLKWARERVEFGQPFAATMFGLPTCTVAPPPWYGTAWRLRDNTCLIPEAEAGAVYLDALRALRDMNFETVCIILRDDPPLPDRPDDSWARRCGLIDETGRPKQHWAQVAEALRGGEW